jgi:Bromodomain
MRTLGRSYFLLTQNNSRLTRKLSKSPWTCQLSKNDSKILRKKFIFILSNRNKKIPVFRYKSREEFVADVRQIFDNCEVFNEDDSPVGKAGHGMRKYFELRWAELTEKQHS